MCPKFPFLLPNIQVGFGVEWWGLSNFVVCIFAAG